MNVPTKQFFLNHGAFKECSESTTATSKTLKHFARAGVLFVAVTLGASAPLSAQIFSDGFESYAVGTLPPQGGWTDFGGSQPITVSTRQAHSGTKSMQLSEGTSGYGSDIFRNFQAAPISGKIVSFSYWQFIESSVDSIGLMYISTGLMPSTFQTGLDLRSGSTSAGNAFGTNMLVVHDVAGTPTLISSQPIITGRWVEYNLTINLIANQFDMRYDGVSILSGAQWDTTPGDGVTLGGIDFWMQFGNANGINASVFYDDFSLVQAAPPTSVCVPGQAGVMACPCSNPPGGPDRGCNNKAVTGGASITGTGLNFLSTPTLTFTTAGENASVLSIMIQGAVLTTGSTFGHGVRCMTAFKRMYQKNAVGGSVTMPDLTSDPSIPVRSATLNDTILPGEKRWYQVYYRDNTLLLPGCPLAATAFNVTSAAEVTWWP